jgi:tRNA(fMet)-specific endonuclease VapC
MMLALPPKGYFWKVKLTTLRYSMLRNYLEKQGAPIGPNAMLIAAHALALDCTVITANDREFSRVPGLKVENWLE